MRHILFGDSVGFGVGDYENGGWATQLRLFIDHQQKSKAHNLINLSIAGDTTRNLLTRMESEAKRRMRTDPPEEFTFIFDIGTNDSRINKSDPSQNISITEFTSNIRQLIELASSLSHEVIFIGLIPVDESKTTPYKENKHYTLERITAYNEILTKITKEKRLRFVNFLPTWKQLNFTTLLDDGLHPNTAGHRLMFETIRDQLF